MNLKNKHCVPCEGRVKPFDEAQINEYLKLLQNQWSVVDSSKISYEFSFESYHDGVDFAVKVAEIAEEQDHHPDIHILYKKVKIELSTHAIKGLSENDFIMAAKVEDLME